MNRVDHYFVQHIHSFDFDLFGDVFNICENYFVSICDDQSLYVFERPSMKLKHVSIQEQIVTPLTQ